MDADRCHSVLVCLDGIANQGDSPVGHHRVVYSYSVAGERYSGKFVDYGTQEEEYLKPNDTFEVRHDPKHPSRSYYPDLRTRRKFILICLAIGFALAALVLVINIFGHAFQP